MLLADVFDYTISIATENNIYNAAVKKYNRFMPQKIYLEFMSPPMMNYSIETNPFHQQ
jgi:hypothetical protein